ncbi:hypothetical protein RSOLAG1IB_06048 [Rhizoctonia solani AG-1 IB]|uniref:Uncharacterized protein n=1 Tax=Thanatephorus cucumeris (strain AG1-IB / isolate 7/3/14) TaxID=1108050 RepID=A0A0B7F603_THACB|nr:hypothetical protein RSOLAG1IB_06048 [Rhizoctonia solani AG-1 IB]
MLTSSDERLPRPAISFCMLRRWDRIQHAIIESFPSWGTKPIPTWNLYELEPDDKQRAYLQRKISRLGVTEHDFLRWRNACIAYNLPEALDALHTLDKSGDPPISTPLWVTSHLLRRKVYSPRQASVAVHLALVAVPSYGPLVPAYEQPLLSALELTIRYNLTHVLPALISRILALPTKHHAKILLALCNHDLPSSPPAAISLQLVLNDIKTRSVLLTSETWQSVWNKWVVLHPLGDNFTISLRLQMKDQGFQAPYYPNSKNPKAYTQVATYFLDRVTPSRRDPTMATLTAAAYSKSLSAQFLLGIASTLSKGLLPKCPSQRDQKYPPPSVTFITALILGLIRKGAYSRAIGVWQNAKSQNVHITSNLMEAVVSAYIMSGNFEETLKLLDSYAGSFAKFGPVPTDERARSRLPSTIITLLISRLPAHAKHIAFEQAYERWGIQPDSSALEAVMVGAAQAVAKKSQADLDIRSNMRELSEGFKDLFRKGPVKPEFLQDILSPGPFDKRGAIRIFRDVLVQNWPFIKGMQRGHWEGTPNRQTIKLFIPTPLTARHLIPADTPNEDSEPGSTFDFNFDPCPLHPSPTPPYPHACPTRRAWTAYLSIINPIQLPRALEMMRFADEFLHARPTPADTPLDLFRPERAAVVDALVRWEEAALAGETPIGRAWEETQHKTDTEAFTPALPR